MCILRMQSWLNGTDIFNDNRMHDEIEEKLRRIFNDSPRCECQVVYALSRIRKYLERSSSCDYHSALEFYCDWGLHIDIRNINRVRDVLVVGETNFNDFIHFKNIFGCFLRDNRFPENWVQNAQWNALKDILFCIYSDTPLIIRLPTLTKLQVARRDGIIILEIAA